MAENKNILWQFIYNDCILESGYVTISLHYTKRSAEKAMQAHKEKALAEFSKMNFEHCVFAEYEDWKVQPIEVLP